MASFDEETERRLLANDPTLTSLSLSSSDPLMNAPSYSQRVGRALSTSTHLRELGLDVQIFRQDWESFMGGTIASFDDTALGRAMQFILVSPLESLDLNSNFRDPSYPGILDSMSQLLDAVNQRIVRHQNPLKSVSLRYLVVEADTFASLIRDCSLQEFKMECCVLHQGSFGTEERAIEHVAQSFATNTTLTKLSLGVFDINAALVCAILQNEEYSWKVVALSLSLHFSGDDTTHNQIANALAHFVRTSPCPLTLLGLANFSWTAQLFGPIAEQISTAQTSLGLGHGSMDTESIALLRALYSSNSTNKSLALSLGVSFPSANEQQALMDLIVSTPALTSLRLHLPAASTDSQQEAFHDRFLAVVRGLATMTCSIRYIRLLDYLEAPQMEALVNAIPCFWSVETLQLHLSDNKWHRPLMAAFRSNRSLQMVRVRGEDFTTSDRARLNVYFERNRQLSLVIPLEASSMYERVEPDDAAAVDNRHTFTAAGKLLPPLFLASVDSAVTIGASHVIGGLLAADEKLAPMDEN